MDVEEIKKKESRLRKGFHTKKDEQFTSAHIKAARKILIALKRIRDNRRDKIQAEIYGGLAPTP
jgi:hypothetical protein